MRSISVNAVAFERDAGAVEEVAVTSVDADQHGLLRAHADAAG